LFFYFAAFARSSFRGGTMAIDFSKLNRALMGNSPFSLCTSEVVVKNVAAVFLLWLPRLGTKIQVNLDSWPEKELAESLFIRVRAQGNGCFFDCGTCPGRLLPGKNLEQGEIVFQVLHVLMSNHVDLLKVKKVTVAFMGIGEPFVNKAVLGAKRELHKLIPGIEFVLSTTGPRSGDEVLHGAVSLVLAGLPSDLQMSCSSPFQRWRLGYMKEENGPRGFPVKSWTVAELSQRAAFWKSETGRKVHMSVVVGKGFPVWDFRTYLTYFWYFPPWRCKVKLSPEYDEHNPWGQAEKKEFERKERILKLLGYDVFRFILDGFEIKGVSCASLVHILEKSK
jgi:hypothetical protein